MEFLKKILFGAWLISAGLLSLSGEAMLPLPSWLEWVCGVMFVGGIILGVVNVLHKKPHPDRGDLDKG